MPSPSEPPTIKPELRVIVDGILADSNRRQDTLASPSLDGSSLFATILDQLDLEGRTILELGAGVGELSRHARRCGAAVVDAIDSDPDALEVARYLNVLDDTTRVSYFLHQPLASWQAPRGKYDVTLAFGVSDVLASTLDRVAAATARVLVGSLPGDDDRLRNGLAATFDVVQPYAGPAPDAGAAGSRIVICSRANDGAQEILGRLRRVA